jgi:hypothetical protein
LWLAGPLFIRRGWNPSGMISTIKAEDSFDIGGILGEISAPTLVIGGGRDHFYPTELFRQKASRTRVSSSTRTARGHPPRPALRQGHRRLSTGGSNPTRVLLQLVVDSRFRRHDVWEGPRRSPSALTRSSPVELGMTE